MEKESINEESKSSNTQGVQNDIKGELWDSMEIGGKKYNFCIFSPGGNDTCFVEEIVEDPKLKKELNDRIMTLYSNVEQVGFIDLSKENPRLEMAGGEFCGNATRSFAYRFFNGKEGNGEFKISGVRNKLKAGVTKSGEARAQMPIYKEFSKIQEDKDMPGNYIVEMEGITHYISFGEIGVDRNDEKFIDRVKEKSFQKIKELGLDQYPAAGIMYVKQQGHDMFMEPVVYVKSVDTLFYETACGSGTTALGLVLAAQNKNSIENISITQPSGQDIKISIQVNGDKTEFGYAQIQGKIKELQSGNFEKDNEICYVTEKIKTVEELNDALKKAGLINLYKDLFSKAPYFENYSDEEVADVFKHYLDDGMLFVTKEKGKVIGFGAAVPLVANEGVKSTLKNVFEKQGRDINDAWYMADLGVDENYRGKDIAKKLVLQRLQSLPKGSIVVMRTSIENDKSRSIYEKFGFKELHNVYQDVHGKRQDNKVKGDQRRFSYAIK